jgi:archaellum component FlaC
MNESEMNKSKIIEDLSYENIMYRQHMKRQDEEIKRLLQRLERYENNLKEIMHLSQGGPEPRVHEINRIAEEALKDEAHT